eukprot:UN24431
MRAQKQIHLISRKIQFLSLKILGQVTFFNSTRISMPYYAPTCKAMKRWIILYAVCTLNY